RAAPIRPEGRLHSSELLSQAILSVAKRGNLGDQGSYGLEGKSVEGALVAPEKSKETKRGPFSASHPGGVRDRRSDVGCRPLEGGARGLFFETAGADGGKSRRRGRLGHGRSDFGREFRDPIALLHREAEYGAWHCGCNTTLAKEPPMNRPLVALL